MKRIVLIVALSLSLAGCGTPVGDFVGKLTAPIANLIPQQTADQAQEAYGAALTLFNGYRRACANLLIPQSCRPIVVRIQGYIRDYAQPTSLALRRSPDSPTLISALMTAASSIKTQVPQ